MVAESAKTFTPSTPDPMIIACPNDGPLEKLRITAIAGRLIN
jgi:hypothetical protein